MKKKHKKLEVCETSYKNVWNGMENMGEKYSSL